MTRSTSIPIIDAASRSNEVARIARPTWVRAMKIVSATMRQTVVVITKSCMYWISNGPIVTLVKSEPASNENESYCFGADPKRMHRELLEEERHAERADERCDPRRALLTQRPIGEALDDDPEQRRRRAWRRGT